MTRAFAGNSAARRLFRHLSFVIRHSDLISHFQRCRGEIGGLPSPRFMAQVQEPPVRSASTVRADGREAAQLRPIRFQNHIAPHATGSTLIEWGNTRVICGITVEDTVPRWMKEQSVTGGWITAEYSMLPYSTLQR